MTQPEEPESKGTPKKRGTFVSLSNGRALVSNVFQSEYQNGNGMLR